MEMLQQIGVFAAQTLLILFSIIAIILLIALLASKSQHKPELEVENLNKKYDFFSDLVKHFTLTKADRKKLKKEKKKNKKTEADPERHLFVIDFHGDIKASQVECLREEITALLQVATPKDEVFVRLESPGGMVHGYGLAASQLVRIRDRQIPLTISVDKVAASGGYLMACTANKILSAPFAIIGSVGVVAQVPNFHKLLRKYDVDYKEYTAGEFKRTISIFGEITPKKEEKFQEQLEETHALFKSFVQRYRPQLDMEKLATGEHWYGEQALTLQLVDEIITSDDYLLKASKNARVIHLKFSKKQKLGEKLTQVLGRSFKKGLLLAFEDLEQRKLF